MTPSNASPIPSRRLLKTKEFSALIGRSRYYIARRLKDDPHFPRPVQLSTRLYGWYEDEVLAWLESRRVVAR